MAVHAEDAHRVKPAHGFDGAPGGGGDGHSSRPGLAVPDFDAVGLQVCPFQTADFTGPHASLQGKDEGAANGLGDGGRGAG